MAQARRDGQAGAVGFSCPPRVGGIPEMTVPTFFLTLVGLLLVVFGFLASGNVPIVALGVVALIAAGVLEAFGRRRG